MESAGRRARRAESGRLVNAYYADDYVTLYHGDCREITAWLAADVLVTDPPYGISWEHHGGGVGPKTKTTKHDGIANDDDTTVRDEALRLWPDSRPSIVFGSFRAPAPAGVVQTLVWKKPIDAGVVGSTTGYRTDAELVFLRGPHERRNASRSSVLESRGGMANYRSGHPHAKPVGILEQLIGWTLGDVADPFAGSGSTLIAARNLGRKAIGVEIDERYCELTARRLDQLTFDFAGSEI
ncbi:site-specific DNA-methyltransferase [Mycolicibacterium goodii]|nr:site-specific DNA-methyltransferase [Mycolicibacterium goodii]